MTPWRLFGVQVPMADGVSLSTDVVLPAAGAGPWPAILIRTPYSKVNDRILGWADFFADYGYAVVAQDVRGRGDSDGVWEPWINEFDDGHDTVEWIAAQPWCTGKVGMLGGSYEGWVQWAAASRHPAHLAAMVTSGSPGRWFRDWPYRFGAFYASDYLEWLNLTAGRVVQPFPFPSWAWYVSHPSLRTLDTDSGRPLASWQAALDHGTYDGYWHSLDIAGYEQMDIPVLHVTGWFDACAPGEFHHFGQMRERSPAADRQSLVVGPWDHGGAVVTGRAVEGDLAISAQGTVDLRLAWERWFARFLKDQRADTDEPQVRYYTLGVSEWRESSSWPPAGRRSTCCTCTPTGRRALSHQPRKRSGSTTTTRPVRYEHADAAQPGPASRLRCRLPQQRLADDLSAGHHRVEHRERVLQDQADLTPALGLELPLGELEQVLAPVTDLAAGAQSLGQQAHDRAGRHRLPAARLADDPDRFPWP